MLPKAAAAAKAAASAPKAPPTATDAKKAGGFRVRVLGV